MKNNLSDKSFKCSKCEEHFGDFTQFDNHMKSHFKTQQMVFGTRKAVFECETCHRIFKHSSKLKVHERIHTGEKPFKCNHCNKAYPYSSSLKHHLKIHSGDKLLNREQELFTCQICCKTFNKSHNLNLHEKRNHLSNEKLQGLHKCEICSNVFRTSEYLKQ